MPVMRPLLVLPSKGYPSAASPVKGAGPIAVHAVSSVRSSNGSRLNRFRIRVCVRSRRRCLRVRPIRPIHRCNNSFSHIGRDSTSLRREATTVGGCPYGGRIPRIRALLQTGEPYLESLIRSNRCPGAGHFRELDLNRHLTPTPCP